MKTAAIILLAATVGLGVVLGVQYLGQARRRPGLVSLHLVAGLAGLELVLLLLHWAPMGLLPPPGNGGAWAVGVLAAAAAGGLAARLSGRRWPVRAELLLGAHAVAGVAGLLVLLSWAARL